MVPEKKNHYEYLDLLRMIKIALSLLPSTCR